jgi:hypothetical protein
MAVGQSAAIFDLFLVYLDCWSQNVNLQGNVVNISSLDNRIAVPIGCCKALMYPVVFDVSTFFNGKKCWLLSINFVLSCIKFLTLFPVGGSSSKKGFKTQDIV